MTTQRKDPAPVITPALGPVPPIYLPHLPRRAKAPKRGA
ncbi:hypothetical protein EV186_103997 [Labedaea rhizosphaerae]|uniref:Uncharacterized protein n=1 Tax=Labedaea rhizosphaerae TaxID=598644 RepID=A0A4R6SE78_LABRH|nr:hypothetical protein EV186_103997 [Labedaea rhizosphaerae]